MVTFAVIAVEAGEFPVNVTAIESGYGADDADFVMKKLHVIVCISRMLHIIIMGRLCISYTITNKLRTRCKILQLRDIVIVDTNIAIT